MVEEEQDATDHNKYEEPYLQTICRTVFLFDPTVVLIESENILKSTPFYDVSMTQQHHFSVLDWFPFSWHEKRKFDFAMEG